MRFVADLHIHSRFSRATSRDLTLPQLHAWAQRKGLGVLGTGDITHPGWIEEIADQLVPAEAGLFRLRPDLARDADAEVPAACRGEVRFLLQGEVSSIYKHAGAVRKVHNVVFCPDLPTARRFLGTLDRLGNIRSDGRPILGLSSRDVLEILVHAGPGAHLVPAHVWTPWFSILGSKSGYDSVEACFEDLAGEVFALETGLSSDPAMNWRVSGLDRFSLISNSDAHSPSNLAREANEFDCALSYPAIFEALRRAPAGGGGFLGTLEFFPEEGKYHLDGHRKCEQRLLPAETTAAGGRCPSCGAPVTVGVLHRVEELADRPEGTRPPQARPFSHLVPLPEVVAECFGVGPASKRVKETCERLWATVGSDLFVLRDAPLEDAAKVGGPVLAEALRRVRAGDLQVQAGYDGEFGIVSIFRPEERRELAGQSSLFALAAPAPRGPTHRTGERAARISRPSLAAAKAMEADPGQGDRFLAGLNPEQRRAVLAPPSPLAIQAGPGTGKTRTLTHRVAHKIVGGLPAENVLAVTFTNRAADELRERLTELLGDAVAGGVTVCTLHRLGLGILREEAAAVNLDPHFAVWGRDECLSLLSETTGLKGREARDALEAFSLAARGKPVAADLETARKTYRAALERAGAVEPDDLIALPVRLLAQDEAVRTRWQRRWAHVAVDEFQDLDPVQYRLIELLAPGTSDVTVIGDPNQSIYGFRGAAPELLERFLAHRPGATSVALTRNYRSAPSILGAAAQALAPEARGPEVLATLSGGAKVQWVEARTDRAEADFIAREVVSLLGGTNHQTVRSSARGGEEGPFSLGEVAVLYRLKAQRPLLEEALQRAGIPSLAVGEEPALLRGRGRQVLEGLRAWAASASAASAVRSCLSRAGLAEGHPTAGDWFAAAAASGDVGALLERVALQTPEDDFAPRAERVTLLTLHAAKGLEFPVVFVTGCEEGILPHLRGETGEDDGASSLAEERRLLYVGMTRARRLLYLTRARSRVLHGERRERPASRFLADVVAEFFETRRVGNATPNARSQQLALL